MISNHEDPTPNTKSNPTLTSTDQESSTNTKLTRHIPIAEPEPFKGTNYPVHIFISKLNLYFRANHHHYETGEAKSLYLLSKLQETAYEWALPIIELHDALLEDFDTLVTQLKLTFEDPDREAKAENELSSIVQGPESVREYSSRYTKLCREVDWNEAALAHRFRQGLSPRIKDVLATLDLPRTVSELTILASKVEQRLVEREREKVIEGKSPLTRRNPKYDVIPTKTTIHNPTNSEDPNLNELWANLPERQRRYLTRTHLGQCTYCGDSDHQLKSCSKRKPDASGKGKAQSQH
jgi:Retrotransposon gag protein